MAAASKVGDKFDPIKMSFCGINISVELKCQAVPKRNKERLIFNRPFSLRVFWPSRVRFCYKCDKDSQDRDEISPQTQISSQFSFRSD